MQKKLIAVAIAGLASSGAFAQMNVTVYGQIDLAVSFESGTSASSLLNTSGAQTGALLGVGNTAAAATTQAGSRTAMRSGLYRGSYLGFKGTEDLGGGLKADFVVESTINADGNPDLSAAANNGQSVPIANTANGQGLFGDSESSIAITGAYGRVKFGRQSAFLATLFAATDPYFGKGPGGVEQLVISPFTTTKLNNSIRFDTKLGPVGVGYQFGMSENQDNVAPSTSGSASTLWATYSEGPLFLLAGQGISRDYAVVTAFRRVTSNVIGGTYNFGVAKLHAMWSTNKTSDSVADTTNLTRVDARTYLLGVTVPMGAHAFKISYVNTDDKRAYNMDANSWGLGYEYDFSKRTKFYSRLAKVNNSNGSTFGVIGGGGQVVASSGINTAGGTTSAALAAATTYNRTNAFTLGLQHSF